MQTLLKPLALALLLAGCSFTPDYQQPDVALPQNWMEVAVAEQANSSGKTAAETHWRDYFRDPQLQKLIEEALAHNHNLKTAALNTEIAEAQYGIQRSEFLPTVAANGGITRSRTARDLTGTGRARVGTVHNLTLASSAFELDFFGRVKAMSDQALNKYLATREARDAAELSIISAVVMVGAGGWFLWQRFQTNENLQVGNCLVITGTATNANEEKIDCSDKSKFSYEVSQTVSNTSSCPDNTTSYEISRKSRYGGSSTVKAVCLVPNLHQDVCYNESSSPIAPFDVAECGSAKVKVTKRVDQANASCEAGEDELTYTTPARTYCFGEPN